LSLGRIFGVPQHRPHRLILRLVGPSLGGPESRRYTLLYSSVPSSYLTTSELSTVSSPSFLHAFRSLIATQMSIFRHQILFHQGQPVISINTSSLPHDIPPQDDFDKKLPEQPTKIHAIRCAMKSFPHLPYLLEDPIEASGIFSPLQVFVKNMYQGPKVKFDFKNPSDTPHRWGMDKKTVDDWKTLESWILLIVDGLFRYAKRECGISPLPGFDPKFAGALPSAWPFDKTFPTESEAYSVMHRALTGFHLLFAIVSYAISLCGKPDDDADHPGWAACLQDRYRVPATVVDAVKSSKMNDFTVPRVGVVIWPNISYQWAEHIKFMVKAGCRVYIMWGAQKWDD
jgi:hypothetical protein